MPPYILNDDELVHIFAVMSGNTRRADGTLIPGDALFVREISGISQSLESMCPYVYEHAVSPHLASRMESNPVRMDVIKLPALGKGIDFCLA